MVREHSQIKLILAAIHPRRIVLTATRGKELVGYAIGAVPKRGPGQIFWLYVAPNDRGQNLGLQLLSRMMKLQKQLGAATIALATHDFQRYYLRQGFEYQSSYEIEGVKMQILTYDLYK